MRRPPGQVNAYVHPHDSRIERGRYPKWTRRGAKARGTTGAERTPTTGGQGWGGGGGDPPAAAMKSHVAQCNFSSCIHTDVQVLESHTAARDSITAAANLRGGGGGPTPSAKEAAGSAGHFQLM